jgi:DNA-binding CsgD family transcriptional regulator
MKISQILTDEQLELVLSCEKMFMLLAIDKQRKGFKPVMVLTQEPEEHAHILDIANTVFSNQKTDLAFFNVGMDKELIFECIDQFFNHANSLDLERFDMDNPKMETGKMLVEKPIWSKREIEILQLIVKEYTNEEIAKKLCIAKRTVDNHRVNLMQRASVRNTAGLICYAFRNGLVA